MIPDQITTFIDRFTKLPSIGPRLATRLAFYLAASDRASLAGLVAALEGLTKLERCERCFFFKQAGIPTCTTCADTTRNGSIIAIVEKETDLLALERAKVFNGRYLVLGELAERGVIETEQKLRLDRLAERIERENGGSIQELILALSPTAYGDFTASLIAERFRPLVKKITRLGRGIPTGGELEFADPETLAGSFRKRE